MPSSAAWPLPPACSGILCATLGIDRHRGMLLHGSTPPPGHGWAGWVLPPPICSLQPAASSLLLGSRAGGWWCAHLPRTHPILLPLLGPAGKTLLARAVANRTDACFIRVIGSELVQKYVGEGARMVSELPICWDTLLRASRWLLCEGAC